MAAEFRWMLCALAAVGSTARSQESRPALPTVDLTDRRLPSIQEAGRSPEAPPLARPWYQNIDVWGFGSAMFLDTGDAGTRPHGSFLIKEASIYFEAHAAEDVSLLAEIKAPRSGSTDDQLVRLGELYVHLRDPLRTGSPDTLNAKIGRFDLPFGEEYLREDSIDNPMVNFSAAYPWGIDEGILLYGRRWGVDWFAAVTDGSSATGTDDNDEKAFNLKLAGRPTKSTYLSASVMRTGRTPSGALRFDRAGIMPVGTNFASSAGKSPSTKVDGLLWELDARAELGPSASLNLTFGGAHVSDAAPGFDRDLTWFRIEPRVDLSEKLYAVARWSEFGTYAERKGHLATGRITGDGANAFGWDTNRLQRVAVCAGYWLRPNVVLKLEVGHDRYWVIDTSSFHPGNGDHLYYALEVTAGF